MWRQTVMTVLAILTLMIAGCSSNVTVHNLNNISQQGKSSIVINLNDKIIVNSNPNSTLWWELSGDKNSYRDLLIERYPNNKQHTLTFKQKGKYVLSGKKKSAMGQRAEFSQTLTFVVN